MPTTLKSSLQRPSAARIAARVQAFTLIELLVVLVIIAILVACLLPVIHSAQTQALLVKDVSNLRALQLANITYAGENGHYVSVFSNDSTGAATIWCSNPAFLTYLPPGPNIYTLPLSAQSPVGLGPGMMVNYGYNVTTLPYGWAIPNANISLTPFSVSAPTQTIAFADALDWNIAMQNSDLYTSETYVGGAISYPYNGKTGIVFFDGHAEALPRAQVVNNASLWNIHR